MFNVYAVQLRSLLSVLQGDQAKSRSAKKQRTEEQVTVSRLAGLAVHTEISLQ
jgi:hypothetical protein